MPTADDRITRRVFVGAAAGTLGAAALGGPAAALAKPHRRADEVYLAPRQRWY